MTAPRAPDTAALYDWECRHVLHREVQDVGFWLEQARRTGGAVLELACGTGRLTLALADAGVPVIGLDIDPVMVAAAARSRALKRPPETPQFLVADMRRYAVARRFGLVFVAYNSLQLLRRTEDMVACLRLARHHLSPGGLVGVEVSDFQRGGADGEDECVPLVLADAEGIRLSGTLAHNLESRISRYRRQFAGNGWTLDSEVVMRSLDFAELEVIAADAGLAVVRWWEDGPTVRALAAAAASCPI